MRRTQSKAKRQWLVYVLLALVAIQSGLGTYTFYHFYFQPTGLVDQDTHKSLNRAQLLDRVIAGSVRR